MTETKSVKTLKKQLGAAIAMVLVAAVALGSSTYAWFVSNNSVKATTTNISAQSNSAYLVIDNKTTGKTTTSSTSSTTGTETTDATALYPAQWANNFDQNKTTTGNKIYQFESAYASVKDKANEKSGSRFAVGDPATAENAKYTYSNTFYIGTGTYDGIFDNLHVTDLTVKLGNKEGLKEAIRVLVKCGNNWEVWKPATKAHDAVAGKDAYETTDGATYTAKTGSVATGSINKEAYDKLPDLSSPAVTESTAAVQVSKSANDNFKLNSDVIKAKNDATVQVYIFYDGADQAVYTTNLDNLKDIGVTVTFEATPTEYGKTQS